MGQDVVGEAIAEVVGQNGGLTADSQQVAQRSGDGDNSGGHAASGYDDEADDGVGQIHHGSHQEIRRQRHHGSQSVNNRINDISGGHYIGNGGGKSDDQSGGQHLLVIRTLLWWLRHQLVVRFLFA